MNCLRHLRTGGAWEWSAPICHLDLLPFRAQVVYGEVPLYPSREEFDLAVTAVFHHPEDRAAHWRVEAVRWRRNEGHGKPLEDGLPVIAGRLGARLWKLAERRQAEAA